MNEELTLAIDELRERPSNRTWFIPVLINDIAIPSRPISRVEDLGDIQAVRLYENWNDNVRRTLHVIKHDDPVSARIDFLVKVLQSPIYKERVYALQELHAIGPDAANAELRARAVDVLRDIGPAAADAVPTLAEVLKERLSAGVLV